MKKLLGILGTITITGSGISGIVGNKPYSTQENNKIRIKRQDNNSFRTTIIKGILIITNSVNWGKNFIVQITPQACSAIKSASSQVLNESIRYLKKGAAGVIPGVVSGYVYNKISNSSEIYSYQEATAWGASVAGGSIATTLQSDIINGITKLYNYWEENPQQLMELVNNYYEQGRNLLISFTNNENIPDLISAAAGN
ncbi:hypothetical protein [Spiroplasma endosymbiont of Dilophus febrilis]|uniref:hypothetical protein n=1 Tax=Spiroplasma endosymbiont of Dilophus febrilis TaxID=3066292 RepID=UPI00313AC143